MLRRKILLLTLALGTLTCASSWNISASLHVQTGVRAASHSDFKAALQYAEKHDDSFGKLVLMATVQEQMAKQHLPILLATLKQAADLARHIIIVALDDRSYKVCQKVHDKRLCLRTEVESTINGKFKDSTIDEHGHSSSKWLVGWMKTKLTQRAVLDGYGCMFLDIDQVFFKDPFKAIDPKADMAVTNDCVWQKGYHPKWDRKEGAMPNLGLTWFRTTDHAKAVLKDWLARAAPDTWDQWQLKVSMEHMSDVNSGLYIQMLSEELFGNFCCDFCSKWVDAIVGRMKGWVDWCPSSQRERFVAFHVACIKSEGRSHGYDQDDHDETLEKRDAMLTVWEAVNGTAGFLLPGNLTMESF